MAELLNEFSWSRSRDALFQDCHRAYWFNHYGAWGGWKTNAAPTTRELYILKNLNTRATWIGGRVHEAVELIVKALHEGQHRSQQQALESLEVQLRQDRAYSLAGRYRHDPKRSPGFVEDYYQERVSDEEWEQAITTALECVRTFYRSPVYRRLEVVGPDGILSVEDLHFFRVDGVKVWIKMDLAMRGKDGGVVIVDWKTGLHHDPDDITLQLGIYGLFGLQFWKIPAELLRGFDVNLRSGEVHNHVVDANRLQEVESHIRTSIRSMMALLKDPQQNIADEEDFARTEDLRRCRRCRFRGMCER